MSNQQIKEQEERAIRAFLARREEGIEQERREQDRKKADRNRIEDLDSDYDNKQDEKRQAENRQFEDRKFYEQRADDKRRAEDRRRHEDKRFEQRREDRDQRPADGYAKNRDQQPPQRDAAAEQEKQREARREQTKQETTEQEKQEKQDQQRQEWRDKKAAVRADVGAKYANQGNARPAEKQDQPRFFVLKEKQSEQGKPDFEVVAATNNPKEALEKFQQAGDDQGKHWVYDTQKNEIAAVKGDQQYPERNDQKSAELTSTVEQAERLPDTAEAQATTKRDEAITAQESIARDPDARGTLDPEPAAELDDGPPRRYTVVLTPMNGPDQVLKTDDPVAAMEEFSAGSESSYQARIDDNATGEVVIDKDRQQVSTEFSQALKEHGHELALDESNRPYAKPIGADNPGLMNRMDVHHKYEQKDLPSLTKPEQAAAERNVERRESLQTAQPRIDPRPVQPPAEQQKPQKPVPPKMDQAASKPRGNAPDFSALAKVVAANQSKQQTQQQAQPQQNPQRKPSGPDIS